MERNDPYMRSLQRTATNFGYPLVSIQVSSGLAEGDPELRRMGSLATRVDRAIRRRADQGEKKRPVTGHLPREVKLNRGTGDREIGATDRCPHQGWRVLKSQGRFVPGRIHPVDRPTGTTSINRMESERRTLHELTRGTRHIKPQIGGVRGPPPAGAASPASRTWP